MEDILIVMIRNKILIGKYTIILYPLTVIYSLSSSNMNFQREHWSNNDNLKICCTLG